MSLFKRYATIAYDANNFSIISIESISAPVSIPVNKSDYETFFSIVLAPIPQQLNSSDPTFQDSVTSYTEQFGLGWILRTYGDELPALRNQINLLRGFLTVPLQFSTGAWHLISKETLPPDLKTIASKSRVAYRAMIQAWTVVIFGVMFFALILWSIACLIWLCFRGPDTPGASFFPEMDIINQCHDSLTISNVSLDSKKVKLSKTSLSDVGTLKRSCNFGFGMSADIVKAARGKRVFCGIYQDSKAGKPTTIIATEEEIEHLCKHQSSTSDLARLSDNADQRRLYLDVSAGTASRPLRDYRTTDDVRQSLLPTSQNRARPL
jgi:hypothetical protein